MRLEFCGEGDGPDVNRFGKVPTDVLAAVMRSKEGRDARRDGANTRRDLNPAKLLTGVRVPLADDGSRFYLVQGSGALSGADNTWFWIVKEFDQKAESLAFLQASCVDIETSRTQGHRNITVLWYSAAEQRTERFSFDGRAYKLRRTSWRPNDGKE